MKAVEVLSLVGGHVETVDFDPLILRLSVALLLSRVVKFVKMCHASVQSNARRPIEFPYIA